MSQLARKPGPAPPRRRYMIHISSVVEAGNNARQYLLRIQLWSSRPAMQTEWRQRIFADECVLAVTLNPLLPRGSDVLDVLGCIDCKDGFFYLLHLTSQEAELLGWRT